MADLPEYQKTEKLTPATIPQPFAQAGRDIAANSNVLSNIGSDLAVKAAVARSELAGIKYGKEPKGELLPAITLSDQAFHKAYRATAISTLSTQANELLNNSIVSVSQANKLTPGLLNSFNDNVTKGFDDIIAQAPSQDKEALREAFASQLINTNAKLQAKMIGEQKEAFKNDFMVYASNTNSEIFNLSSSGMETDSKNLSSSYEANIREQMASGVISSVEGETLLKEARTTQLTGREFSKAQSAIERGDLSKFLSEYGKSKPNDMTETEWVEVGQKLLNLVNFTDSLESKQQAFKTSEGNLHVVDGTVSNQVISDMQDSLTPTNFNNWLIGYQKALASAADKGAGVAGAIQGFNDIAKFSQLKDKDINAAYNILWAEFANANGMDEWSAKSAVATSAGGAIPAYIDELNARGQTSNPEYLESAFNAIQTLKQGRAANLKGMNEKTLGMVESYARQRAGGIDPIVAAKNSEKMVLQVDETEKNRREAVINDATKRIFKKNTQELINGAYGMTGIQSSTDPIGLALITKQNFEDNFRIVGNELDAQNMTRTQMQALYSTTNVNGKAEDGQFETVEMTAGIGKEQLPLIQVQVAQQIGPQIERFNELFASGNSDFRYDFKYPTTIDLDTFARAKAELDEIAGNATRLMQKGESYSEYAKKTFSNPEIKARYEELQNILKAPVGATPAQLDALAAELKALESQAVFSDIDKTRFSELSDAERKRIITTIGQKGDSKTAVRMQEIITDMQRVEDITRPKVIRTYTDGTKDEFYLNVYRDPNKTVDSNGAPIYFVKLQNKDGRVENFMGVAPRVGGEVVYTIDLDDLNQKLGRYMQISSSGGKSAIADMQRSMQAQALKASEFIKNKQSQKLNYVQEPLASMIEATEE